MTSFQILGPDGRVRVVHSVKEPPSARERVLAARARVSADRLRGASTEAWIVELAKGETRVGERGRVAEQELAPGDESPEA